MELLNEPIKKPRKSKKTKIIEDSKPSDIFVEIPVKTEDELLLDEYNVILKKYFGYDTLKKEQFEAIKNIIVNKRNILFIINTGAGKSITFQMIHVITKKNVIVISPLIALMTDQEEHMKACGINVCVLNSTNKNKKETIKLLETVPHLIYTSPEWIVSNLNVVQELYDSGTLELIALDEAHLLDSWSDFRNSYDKLSSLKENFSEIPFICLTATATHIVREKIIDKLNLQNPLIIVGDFNRPNLYYEIKQRNKNTIIDEIENLIIKYQKEDRTIIYCKTKKNTEEICAHLNSRNIPCEFYHAELTDDTRKNIYYNFISGKHKVICATISFGQGISINNVRLVIHYSATKTLDLMAQECGRGGRDSKQSYCFMFYENSDITIHKKQNQETRDPVRKKYLSNEIQKMEEYIHTKECRRKLLLSHFGQHYEGNCNNCDNCCKEAKELTNYTVPSYIILSVLSRMQDCGATIIINILRGSKNKYIKEEFTKYPEYGKLKHFSEAYLKNVFQELHNNSFLSTVPNPKHSFATKIIINKTGNVWIRNMKEAYPTYEILIKADNIVNQLLW